ncbi:MAG: PglZ domain-containing protein [Bacteroidales bacterium]|jgi:CheY-like chemotaxis protein
MSKVDILWVDDEIDFLKPHILFLEQKGFTIHVANNGNEALDMIEANNFDIVLLDENMPGLSGLEVLTMINQTKPNLPVVMITKSEEEHIMNDALGSNISDYLIKPVNPNQIWLSLKKIIENNELKLKKQLSNYHQEFRNLSMQISEANSCSDWIDIYKKIIYWELELEKLKDDNISEFIQSQKEEANIQFCKFYQNNYLSWLKPDSSSKPDFSHTVLKNRLFPKIKNDNSLFLIVIDNLRYDQWKILEPIISQYFRIAEDDVYFSILPTATHYARNALFSGMMPSEIKKKYPQYWIDESAEENKNKHEQQLFAEYLKRYGLGDKFHFWKVLNMDFGRKMVESVNDYFHNPINVVIYNFIDMLSHARTDVELIRELASDEAAYRSVTISWFEHSSLFDLLKKLSENKIPVVITSDHGTIKVTNPVKILGDKNINANLRYKVGKTLGGYNPKEVFEIPRPEKVYLPIENISNTFVFSQNNDFFVYPNNYNHYVNYYKNTFQHGGISLEECLVPFVKLIPR